MWPIAIVAVLALTVGANAWILYVANRDPNGAALESDYYRKAVAFDSTLVQARRDSVLGWQLAATPGPYRPGGTAVRVALHDRFGKPLAGASVGVIAIHNLEGGRERRASGVTGADGTTTETLPLGRPGLWELRFDVRHAGERFTSDLRRDVAALAPAPPP